MHLPIPSAISRAAIGRDRSRPAALTASAIVVPLAVVTLAFALRLYRIDSFGVWFDDTHSIHMARLSLMQMVAEISEDIHPPLYFLLLGWWMQFTGSTEFALRYFTVATGVLAVPLMYALGRRIGGMRVGAVAALMLAISPLVILYTQDVRMYTPSLSLVTAVAYFGWRGIAGEPARRWVVPYAVIAAASGYTLLFNLAIVPAMNVAYVLLAVPAVVRAHRPGTTESAESRSAAKRSLLWWMAAQVGAGVLLLPWLPVLGRKDLVGAATEWHPLQGLWPALNTVWGSFTFGYSPKPGVHYWAAESVWILAAAGLVGMAALALRRRPLPGVWYAALLGLVWLVVCFVFVYLGLGGRRDVVARYVLVVYPGFALLVGAAAAMVFRNRWLLFAGIGLVVLAFAQPLNDYYRDPQLMRPDDRAAIRAFEKMAVPGDVGVFIAHYHSVSYEYYAKKGLPMVSIPTPDVAGKRAAEPGVRAATERALTDLASKHERIWVFYWTEYYTDPDGIAETWLNNNLVRFHESVYNGWLRLKGYERRLATENTLGGTIQLAAYEVTPTPLIAGARATVKLTWRGVGKPGKDYQVFVHLIDKNGKLVSQHDGPPDGGKTATGKWSAGTRVEDKHDLEIPAGTPPGEYELRVGFYGLDDMQRLRTENSDHLLVGKVKVVQK